MTCKKFFFSALFFLALSTILSQSEPWSISLVGKNGRNLLERIFVPYKFERILAEQGSFADYIRTYPLKSAGSPVYFFDGRPKPNQDAHVAVFALPLGNFKMQEGAQSIIRLYAEYFYKTGNYDRIQFYERNGNLDKWSEWKKDFRISVAGNLKKWTKFEEKPNQREAFDAYLRNVFAYTDIYSTQIFASEPISFSELQIGDIVLDMGISKHICMVVDICENSETGEKAILLAKGSSPAQEFYILKNPKRVNDPWYHEEDFTVGLVTPECTFPHTSWRRLKF